MRQIRNYVGGRFVDGVATFPDVDPTTGAVVAEVHEAGEALVDRAVAAARAAHDGPWSRTTVQERCDLLRRLADLVDVWADDLVRAEVLDTGKPSRVRPVSFELGGKNAAVVFADADLDAALDGLAQSVFANTGQVCLCTERVYVERSVFDDVCTGLVERAEALHLGAPDDPHTTGPLISAAHREKVLGYLRLAEKSGAETRTGGEIPDMPDALDGGWWLRPMLWTGLTNADRVVREEIFGPVAALIPFDDEDEAVRLANDTDYGLAAVVWTSDLRRAHRVAQRMDVGISWVNTWFLRELRSPFGGTGLSGIGREGGRHSLDFYTETTNVCVAL